MSWVPENMSLDLEKILESLELFPEPQKDLLSYVEHVLGLRKKFRVTRKIPWALEGPIESYWTCPWPKKIVWVTGNMPLASDRSFDSVRTCLWAQEFFWFNGNMPSALDRPLEWRGICPWVQKIVCVLGICPESQKDLLIHEKHLLELRKCAWVTRNICMGSEKLVESLGICH